VSLKEFVFTVEKSGARLDKFVSEHCPGVSRTLAQKMIEAGQVTVNEVAEKASFKLTLGDMVKANVLPSAPSPLMPEDIPIKILYEDDDVLVVDKPAGLTVHPAAGQPSHTLVNAVLGYLADMDVEDEDQRPGIVHRLDKDTSGVMLVARNSTALEKLAKQFRDRTVKKTYLALVVGQLKPEQGVIDAPIGRDSGDRKKMAITEESRGKHARTNYKVIRYIGNYTLLEVKPETGRTHQIRVHLTAIGYPIFGDATYGKKSRILARQFLHAHRLGFNLPSTGKWVEFESPLPDDLEKALKEIEG